MFRPVTKWADRIYDARRIPEIVATAFRQAMTGRLGPVYLDLPGDILGEKVDEEKVVFPPAWKPLPRPLGDRGAVEEAIALLSRAERPIVLGGSGVWWSDAAAAFQQLVETIVEHAVVERLDETLAVRPERARLTYRLLVEDGDR